MPYKHTYINSSFSRFGGFFLVDRWSSATIFCVSLTTTSPEKMVKMTCDEIDDIGSICCTGANSGDGGETGLCVLPVKEEKREEKKPV
jgi:hypothetical protein